MQNFVLHTSTLLFCLQQWHPVPELFLVKFMWLSHITLLFWSGNSYDFCNFVPFNFDPQTAGNVVCSWGRGEDGQLGHGDTDDRLLPTKLSALDGQDIVSVICGADYTVARSQSGKDVYSWGWSALYLNHILFSIIEIAYNKHFCDKHFNQ